MVVNLYVISGKVIEESSIIKSLCCGQLIDKDFKEPKTNFNNNSYAFLTKSKLLSE